MINSRNTIDYREHREGVRVWLIRHGATAGNLEHRYVGTTEEPLCEEGRRALQNCNYPPVDVVVCSPMKRCLETADILYPGIPRIIETSLRECDFGRFEGKNYKDLTGDAEYQYWIDHNGRSPFPGGEDVQAFRKRCGEGFLHCMEQVHTSVAFVVHGGTLMSILAAYGLPAGDYYDFQVRNGEGYETLWDGSHIHILSSVAPGREETEIERKG